MQMQIISPQEGGFLTEIKWNNKQLLAEITAKTEEYKNVVYTDDGWVKTAKSDRAKLNKLRTSIETERKRIKAAVMKPYNDFEAQVKEVIAPIDDAMASIDKQLKAADEKYKTEKMAEIREAFIEEGFQDFVDLEMIWDEKWLTKAYTINKVKQDLQAKKFEIGTAVMTIHGLSEYSFEALDYYKRTLDLTGSLNEAQRLVELQRRKAEQKALEEERKRKEEEARKAKIEAKKVADEQIQAETQKTRLGGAQGLTEVSNVPAEEKKELIQLDFRVWGTKEQLIGLRQYMKDNNIKVGKVG